MMPGLSLGGVFGAGLSGVRIDVALAPSTVVLGVVRVEPLLGCHPCTGVGRKAADGVGCVRNAVSVRTVVAVEALRIALGGDAATRETSHQHGGEHYRHVAPSLSRFTGWRGV